MEPVMPGEQVRETRIGESPKMAKEEGVKFSFGSNSGGRAPADLGFCIETAKTLGLTAKDMFVPAARDRKPILVRKLRA